MSIDIMPTNDVYELADGDELSKVYAFGIAETDPAPGGYQVQRWFIPNAAHDRRPPRTRAVLRKTSHAPWDAINKISGNGGFRDQAIKEFAKSTVSPEARYVAVNSERRERMASLPRPMPRPQHPGTPTGTFQPDIGTTHLFLGGSTVGYIETFALDGSGKTTEYWVLLNGYSATSVELQTLARPEDFADIMDRAAWNQSATLVACACSYFSSVPPNF